MVETVGYQLKQPEDKTGNNQKNKENHGPVGTATLVDQLLLLAGVEMATKIENQEVSGAKKTDDFVDIDKKVIAIFLVHFQSFGGSR